MYDVCTPENEFANHKLTVEKICNCIKEMTSTWWRALVKCDQEMLALWNLKSKNIAYLNGNNILV